MIHPPKFLKYALYVYILQSKKDSKLYIGYANNLQQRLKLHNPEKVKATKK